MKIFSKLFFLSCLALLASMTCLKMMQDKGPELKPAKLSQTLRETSPDRALSRTEFINHIHYALFSLTRGELEQIFSFADINHDDLVSPDEWEKFVAFYILPFEKCDKNGKYVLDKAGFKDCWDKDPKSKLIQFRKKYEKNGQEIIMSVVSSRKSGNVNFSDYLIIRRAMFGWSQCQSSSKYIAKSHFKCAFKLAVPQKYHLKIDVNKIFDIGLNNISNDIAVSQMDFIGFLKTIYSSYVFSVFSLPHNNPYMEKTQFLKGLSEDRIPNFFEENEVHTFYNLISTNPVHKADVMNFETWAFFFNLNRLFEKYSKSRPLHLAKAEFLKLLEDPLTPISIIAAVDKTETKFTTALYKEASLYLQKKKTQESEFFFGFKEKQPEWFVHRSDVVSDFLPFPRDHLPTGNITKNDAGRKLFFDVMVDVDKEFWNKFTYYKTFQLSNLFVHLTNDLRYIASVSSVLDVLPKYYDIVNPPISQSQRRNLAFYKTLPKECFLDLITFLEIESYEIKFRNTKISNIKTVHESLLKIVMKDFGMENIPDEVIDLAKTGYDNLKRRIYDSDKVMHILITIQSISAELLRTKAMRKAHTLKENKDAARTYPLPNRRVKDSELV